MDPRLIYSAPFMIAAVLISIVAFFAFARRNINGGGYLAWLCVAASFWSATEGMLYMGLGTAINMRITLIQYLGIAPVPPLALVFSLSVLGGQDRLNQTRRLVLLISALIIILLVLTNGWHQLVFTNFHPIHDGPLVMLGLTHGPLWWVIIAYHYALVALLTLFLIQQVRGAQGYYRLQATVILASVTMVWLANAVYVSGNSPVPNMDISPIAFSLVALSMAWGFFRYNLLDLLPIAKAEIFRGLDDAILVIDNKERIVDINPAAVAVFQVQVGQAIGQSIYLFFDRYPQFHDLMQNQIVTGGVVHMGAPEQVLDMRVSNLTDRHGVARGKLIVLHDITHHKQSEIRLQASEKRFRKIIEQVAEISIQGYDEHRRVTFWNRASEKLYGFTAGQALGKKLEELIIPPHMRQAVIKGHRRWVDHGEKIPAGELVLMDKNGADAPVFSSHVMHETPQGKEMFCIDIDLAPIKQAQRALLESEAHFRAIFHSTSDFIFLKDRQRRYLKLNPAMETLFQLSADQMVGKTDADFFDKKSAQDIAAIETRVLSGEIIEQEDNKVVNGQMRCFHVIKTPVHDSMGAIAGLCGIARDITELRELSERLRQSQKMEAIGTLAGGIAHDFNNILFPLMGYTEMLQADIPAGSPLQNYITGILNASLRAKDLVKQILTFSRRAEQERKPLKLQRIVKESLSLVRKSIPATVDIQQEIDPDCGMVIADPTQMHQVLINLATNAYQSMEQGGGLLKVMLAQTKFDADRAAPADLSAGKYAHLIVSDNGIGIGSDILAQIFDPYFTTKLQGKGTGLGLSVVQGIVKKCEGDIRVDSEPGKGTAVHVYLPITENVAETSVDRLPAPILSGGMENILLIDDEAVILDMERQMLERLGYRVTTRISGLDGLEAFKANPDRFDLVLTDMSMPNITGIQLAEQLKKIKPQVPVVLCTGFSDQLSSIKRRQLGIAGFIMKPASVREVAATLRQVLDRPAQS